mgnify:CR=1 FL=1
MGLSECELNELCHLSLRDNATLGFVELLENLIESGLVIVVGSLIVNAPCDIIKELFGLFLGHAIVFLGVDAVPKLIYILGEFAFVILQIVTEWAIFFSLQHGPPFLGSFLWDDVILAFEI